MQLGETFKSKYMDEKIQKAWAFTFAISFHHFYYIYKCKLCDKQHTTYCWIYFTLMSPYLNSPFTTNVKCSMEFMLYYVMCFIWICQLSTFTIHKKTKIHHCKRKRLSHNINFIVDIGRPSPQL
jgi:hypothetical protein